MLKIEWKLMLIVKHTVSTDLTPAQIWFVLQDVKNWNTWDHETEFSRIDGEFQTGVKGILKPIKGPALETILTYVRPNEIFVQEAKLFLAKVRMTHMINQSAGKTLVTFKTEICGPLAIFYFWLLGRSIRKKVPVEMEQMLKRAKTLANS